MTRDISKPEQVSSAKTNPEINETLEGLPKKLKKEQVSESNVIKKIKEELEELEKEKQDTYEDGNTTLHLAVFNGQLDIVKYFIDEENSDVNQANNYGNTPLHLAAKNGQLEIVKYLVDKKKVDFNQKNNDGQTALHLAAIHDKIDVVNALIERGANINAVDSSRKIPLRWAVEKGHKNVVEILIQKTLIQNSSAQKPDYLTSTFSTYWDQYKDRINDGQDIRRSSETPVLEIKPKDNKKMDNRSLKQKSKESLKNLEEEQVNNKYQLIKEHLCSSFERCSFTLRDCSLMDIAEDSFDNLMYIWFVHTSNSIKSESEKKLNKELLSILSSTTEFFYKEDDYIKKLKRFLLDNKGNQDLKTVLNLRRGESGLTVLHALSSMAEKDEAYDNAVGLILRAGADPDIQNDRGKTPLHCATRSGSIASLLKAGANPNQQDCEGKTPLHYAAKVELDKESINFLLKSGAELNILDKQGKTPLQTAIDNDNKYIECFFTDNQKRLKEELLNEFRSRGDSGYIFGLTKGLKQFLHKHKNDQDLKVVLNICKEVKKALQDIEAFFGFETVLEVRRLLFSEAGVTYTTGYGMEEYVPESGLWYNLTPNQEMELDGLFKKASEAQNMDQLAKVVGQAIQSGVRLNFPRSFHNEFGEEVYSFMDLVVEKISELDGNIEVASDMVCKLLSRGAMLYSVDGEDVFDILELEFKGHKTNMVKAYEDCTNRTLKFMEIAKSATNGRVKNAKMDNTTFYLEYQEDSKIDVAKVTDGARNLGLTHGSKKCERSVVRIGESEVEIITTNGTRNYTDLADGSDIVLIFYTSRGELEVRLYPDRQNKDQIKVEVQDQEKWKKLKNCKEEIGKNCSLGGLPVNKAIEQGFFTKYGELCQSSERISLPKKIVEENSQSSWTGKVQHSRENRAGGITMR
ncbi:ankyrin repeat domain-containing protein [Wolbachia endosymbiont (group A) of Philonthus cognatus]|uniref:ankyrin repeat domain-containing protein n=1 Tax=Wolbachia endosymbiont (group A) of Philonthus cognatus TaxID=2954046 RepID=UPI002231AEF1|nr:ankyrin repeat domain-containing protein [Wolbachia endosymbiont (group A) of Philonthus cognatus]